jgi:hypothetical protein
MGHSLRMEALELRREEKSSGRILILMFIAGCRHAKESFLSERNRKPSSEHLPFIQPEARSLSIVPAASTEFP